MAQQKVLVLNGTSTSHAVTRAAATQKLHAIQKTVGFAMTVMDDPNPLTLSALNAYDIVVFNFFFDNHLTSAAFQQAFMKWLASGSKAYLGYHTSGANEQNEWNAYRDSVTSMRYFVHTGAAQEGTMHKTTDAQILNEPIMAGLSASFSGIDEWYEFDPGATFHQAKVMYTLDEKSLKTPLQHPMNPHPVAWYREDPSTHSRYVYTTIIHTSEGVNTDFFHSFLLRSLEWTAGYKPTSIRFENTGSDASRPLVLSRHAPRLSIRSTGGYELFICDAQGQMIYRYRGSQRTSHDMTVLRKAGVYFATLMNRDRVQHRRIIVL